MLQRVVQGVVQRVVQRSPRRRLVALYFVAWSFTVMACGDGKQPVAACDTTSFTVFWQGFRAAVQRDEITEIQAFVSDTFAVRGSSDSDAWVRVSENEFVRQWTTLLQQDPGLRIEPETLREYVARTDTLPAQAVDPSQTTARVADLVFQCADGSWRLSRAYTSE